MKTHDEITPFGERKVVRRGLLAGAAALTVGALGRFTATPAHADDPNDVTLGTTKIASARTGLQSLAAGGAGYTVLKVENFRIADAIEAVGGPGSLGNVGGRGLVATGGPNPSGSNALPTNAGNAIDATGGATTGAGVGNGGRGVSASGGASANATGGEGVRGTGGSPGGIGVRGFGGGTSGSQGSGVSGSTNSTNAGVQGTNTGSGAGVRGDSGSGPGVHGSSNFSLGVRGTSTNFVGVVGISDTSHGLYGSTSNAGAAGLVGENLSGGVAGFFYGDVQVFGSLQVFGAPKNAIIRMKDGTDASVYCQESPEPWFEDFGRGRLTGGVANVPLEPEFATLVGGADYLVFLTPSGDTRGLYVAKQDGRGFEVRETQGGTASLGFTYRVVTRRRDIEGRRFARVSDATAKSVAAARAAMATAGPAPHPSSGPSGPSSSLPPQQAVPPIFTNTPPVIPGGNGYTNLPPGAP